MTGLKIPFTGLKRQYNNLREEILTATDSVLSSGQVLDGTNTSDFEQAISQKTDREYAIAVGSCTQALIIAQMAMEIKNSKVLIPAQSFVATLNSVVMAENHPIFVDVDDRAMMDLDLLDFGNHHIDIGAIMYVNLFGHVLDYNKLKVLSSFFNPRRNIKIIEDAAQSFGAKYRGTPSGKLGDISVLSFDPTKNLPNYGSGGMILTDDPTYATLCYNFRDNGKFTDHIFTGTNSKMSEVDCAQMMIKLRHFDAWQKRRTEIAEYYTENLMQFLDPILPPPDVESSWHKYVIRVGDRSKFQSYLQARGISTKVHYPIPLPSIDLAFKFKFDNQEVFPLAETHSKESVSLPIYPEMADNEVEYIVSVVKDYYKKD